MVASVPRRSHTRRGCWNRQWNPYISTGKSGVPYIDAVDQNPNAIYSLDKELERHPLESVVNTKVGDLLCNIESSPLIVFNPPWIPGDTSGSVDESFILSGVVYLNDFSTKRTNAVHTMVESS